MKLSLHTQKWLKVLHVYMGGIWAGGAASLFALHCLYPPGSGEELYIRNMALIYIDNYVIIPAAVGTAITGLIYSQLTRWGYLRYYWIIAKWIITIIFIAIGYFWLIPWLNNMLDFSSAIRHAHMISSNTYEVDMSWHFAMSVIQTILLLGVVILSVFKPWGRTRFKLFTGPDSLKYFT